MTRDPITTLSAQSERETQTTIQCEHLLEDALQSAQNPLQTAEDNGDIRININDMGDDTILNGDVSRPASTTQNGIDQVNLQIPITAFSESRGVIDSATHLARTLIVLVAMIGIVAAGLWLGWKYL